MGHYDSAYDEAYEEERKEKEAKLKRALSDIRRIQNWSTEYPWTPSEIGCEDLFNAITDRLCARLYRG